MTAPLKLLDLFCGAGGAAMGYFRAGFTEIVGIDNRPQPRYPFRFILMNALNLRTGPWDSWDLIHASPPCQPFTCLRSVFDATRYEDLIAPTRELMQRTGAPYVIENVCGAPIRADVTLCAAAFGLRSYRHRIFECSFKVALNRRKQNRRGHWDAGGFVTVTGDIGRYVGPEAMGIDWMTGAELSQAIPPAYTEFIGKQLIAALQGDRA